MSFNYNLQRVELFRETARYCACAERFFAHTKAAADQFATTGKEACGGLPLHLPREARLRLSHPTRRRRRGTFFPTSARRETRAHEATPTYVDAVWRRIATTRYDQFARNVVAAAALFGAICWIKLLGQTLV